MDQGDEGIKAGEENFHANQTKTDMVRGRENGAGTKANATVLENARSSTIIIIKLSMKHLADINPSALLLPSTLRTALRRTLLALTVL